MSLDRQGIKGYMPKVQMCPLCGMTHPIVVSGVIKAGGNVRKTVPDQGYSFCNCNNIWFTDWKNIDQDCYDYNYMKNYDCEVVNKALKRYADYFQIFENVKTFIEIGCINETLLDEANKIGWETYALDINPSVVGRHKRIIGDVEDASKLEQLPNTDVFWASHIFEHFRYPLKVAKNLYDKTNDGGYLFVAMPDPWFINWHKPLEWDHWVIREHHILWDMDSFIDRLIEIGYKLVHYQRNCLSGGVCNKDFHIIFQK